MSYGGGTGSSGEAPKSASYVVIGANATLTAERIVTAGVGITFVDAGAGAALTISATPVYAHNLMLMG